MNALAGRRQCRRSHNGLIILLALLVHPCTEAAQYIPDIVRTLVPRGLLAPQHAARRRLNETDQLPFKVEDLLEEPTPSTPRRLQRTLSPMDQSGKDVMIVTATNFFPCNAGIGNWVQLLALRNKEDYARLHGYGLHWSLNQYGSRIKGPWNKVASLLHLAETLDEERYRWLLWMDYDAIFANMTTVIPFSRYDGRDMIVWATPEKVFEGDARGLNSGVVLFRISSWTRLFLRELLKLGLDWRHGGEGRQMLAENVKNFETGLYEQNGVVWLMKNRSDWRPKLYGEKWEGYVFHALYAFVPDQDGPSPKPVLAVHWAGCQLCSPMYTSAGLDYKRCLTTFVSTWCTANAEAVRLFHMGVPVDPSAVLKLLENTAVDQWTDHRVQFE